MMRFFRNRGISGFVICAFIIAAIISGVYARLLYREARSFSLLISMRSSVSDSAVLYLDTGKGLSEHETARNHLISDHQFHIYNFPLPIETLYNARFDPLTVSGKVSINHVAVVNGFGKSLFPVDLHALQPGNQIKTFVLKNNTLDITTTDLANDPQIWIRLSSPLNSNTFHDFPALHFIGRLLAGFLIFFLSVLFLIWILRRRGIMIHFFNDPVRTSRRWMKENKIFFAVILSILIFRIFFVLTYPLNTCSDWGTYYRLMRDGTNSLIHVTGYPFFMHFAAPFLPTKTDILIFQHLVDFGVQLVLMILLRKRFGLAAAITAGLFYGLELRSINWVSLAGPEWLQGVFLALAFVGAMEAYFAERPVHKVSLYLFSAWAFTWSILVKLLTVVMLPVYLILFILEGKKWRGRWICFAFMGGIFFVQTAVFIFSYQLPSTGTTAFTHDKGFILHEKVSFFLPKGHHLSESGPWSKRYSILVSEMPGSGRDVDIHATFRHVDAIPQTIRKPYQERYQELLAKSHEELQMIINTKNDLKGHIDLWLAYYYLGLAETDSLMMKVFVESVASYPTDYFLEVIKGIKDSFFIETSYYIAIISNPSSDHPFQMNPRDIIQNLPWGYALYNVSPRIRCMYDEPIILKAGLQFFSSWGEFVNIPTIMKWLFMILACVLAFAAYRRDQRFKPAFLYLSMGIMVLLFYITLINLIHVFRDKEFQACQHLLCILLGISVSSIISFVKMFGIFRRKG
jgi:hypothetical protein